MKKPVTVGIDIRDLRFAETGTKTYLEELILAFKSLEATDCRFRFLDTSLPVYGGKSVTGKYLKHLSYLLWKQVQLPLKAWLNKCDIVFCTDNVVPLIHLGYHTVPVFHDAFFFENPEHYGKLWLKLYHLTAMPAARRSAFIVTPSRYAQQQLHRFTHLPLEQFKVVYEGPKSMPAEPDPGILNKFGLNPSEYILHVGSLFKRKNIPMLIEAFTRLKADQESSLKLVLAGPSSASLESNDHQMVIDAIAGSAFSQDIILTGYLSDAELAGIYGNALMYVFPSVNEGFGIPVLEAFAHHLPVLVANNTCLPEIGGNAVLTFDPFDAQDIFLKMRKVIEDPSYRADLIAKGEHRALSFSWKKSAAQLVLLFKSIVHA